MKPHNANDLHYMHLALQEAQKAYDLAEVPIGAIVVAEGKVISQAYNTVQQDQDATAHAELKAIQRACQQTKSKYLPQATLYVTLEPCPMCAMATYWTQIGRIVWATNDEKRGYRSLSKALIHPKTKLHQGPCQAESQRLLQSFFQKLRDNKKRAPKTEPSLPL